MYEDLNFYEGYIEPDSSDLVEFMLAAVSRGMENFCNKKNNPAGRSVDPDTIDRQWDEWLRQQSCEELASVVEGGITNAALEFRPDGRHIISTVLFAPDEVNKIVMQKNSPKK